MRRMPAHGHSRTWHYLDLSTQEIAIPAATRCCRWLPGPSAAATCSLSLAQLARPIQQVLLCQLAALFTATVFLLDSSSLAAANESALQCSVGALGQLHRVNQKCQLCLNPKPAMQCCTSCNTVHIYPWLLRCGCFTNMWLLLCIS